MKIFFIFPLMLFTAFNLAAQNLVPNPSFEEYSQCPDFSSNVAYATGWWGVNNTPDYFNVCDTFQPPLSFGAPANALGWQHPFDGNAYVGMFSYDFDPDYREYIGCALIDSLRAGYTYRIRMQVNRGNVWGLATDKIGMRFANILYTESNPIPLDNTASVWVDTIVADTANWVLLQWNYTPAESFKYLYIGNFFDDANTDTIWTVESAFKAYYYIDSVEILCVDSRCTNASPSVTSLPQYIWYNPASKSIDATSTLRTNFTLIVHDALGRRLLRVGSPPIDASALPSGVYIVTILGDDFAVHHKILVH